MRKKTTARALSIFLSLSFFAHETFAMDQNQMDQNQKEEFKKIMDELIPIPEFKRADNTSENFDQVKIERSKKQMGNFMLLPKAPLFEIFSHFSLLDLAIIKSVSVFFVLAENRSRVLLREILNGASKLYVTPKDLLRAYDQENLVYALDHAKNTCKDFLLENGDFKEDWKLRLEKPEEALELHNYSKLAIALGNETIKNALQMGGYSNDFAHYVYLAALENIDNENSRYCFTTTRNGNPLPEKWWNIDGMRQNIPFLVRMNAWRRVESIESYIVHDWAGIAFDKNKWLSKEYRTIIQNHPKVESLRALIQYSSRFFSHSYAGYIIKTVIPEKNLAENYLNNCLQKPLISFNQSSILYDCIALKELVNLKENGRFIDMMNTENYFENLNDSYRLPEVLKLLHYMRKKELFRKVLLNLTTPKEEENNQTSHRFSYELTQGVKDFECLNELKPILENIGQSKSVFFLDPFEIRAFKNLYEMAPEETHMCLKNLITHNRKIPTKFEGPNDDELKLYYLSSMAKYDLKEEAKEFIDQEMKKITIFDAIQLSDEKKFFLMACLSIFLRLDRRELAQKYFDLSIISILKYENISKSEEILSIFQQKFKDMKSLEELKTKEPFDIGKLIATHDFSDDD